MNRCVVLDPGHGGADPGAVANGLQEKALNLKVAMYAKELLEKQGITVYMTRTTDVDPGFKARTKLVKDKNPAICWSVHHNAGGGVGAEILDKHYNNEDDAVSLHFLQLMGAYTKVRKRFSKLGENNTDYFCMIRETADTDTLAFISEGEFLDSAAGAANLKSDVFLRNEAKCIADTIAWKLGMSSVDTTPATKPATTSDSWKKAGAQALINQGLLDKTWLDKLDEPMPVWAVTTILARILDNIKK